jgi:hypothetical protein
MLIGNNQNQARNVQASSHAAYGTNTGTGTAASFTWNNIINQGMTIGNASGQAREVTEIWVGNSAGQARRDPDFNRSLGLKLQIKQTGQFNLNTLNRTVQFSGNDTFNLMTADGWTDANPRTVSVEASCLFGDVLHNSNGVTGAQPGNLVFNIRHMRGATQIALITCTISWWQGMPGTPWFESITMSGTQFPNFRPNDSIQVVWGSGTSRMTMNRDIHLFNFRAGAFLG